MGPLKLSLQKLPSALPTVLVLLVFAVLLVQVGIYRRLGQQQEALSRIEASTSGLSILDSIHDELKSIQEDTASIKSATETLEIELVK